MDDDHDERRKECKKECNFHFMSRRRALAHDGRLITKFEDPVLEKLFLCLFDLYLRKTTVSTQTTCVILPISLISHLFPEK